MHPHNILFSEKYYKRQYFSLKPIIALFAIKTAFFRYFMKIMPAIIKPSNEANNPEGHTYKGDLKC